MFQISYPLAGIDGLSAYAGGEVFGYLNRNSFGPTGFSEARASAGLTYAVTRHIGVDVGYLGVFVATTGKRDIFSSNLQIGIRYAF